MQTFGWYLRRLRAMSAGEIARRVLAAARDPLDRRSLGRRMRRAEAVAARIVMNTDGPPVAGSAVLPPHPGEHLSAACRARLVERASKLAVGRIPIFDTEADYSPARADWNRDPKHGVRAPLDYAPAIDYRDFRVAGDAKFVWEASRHQHLVVLGRAYRATGDVTYARAAADQLRQWLDQCPYGRGVQWRSPLEFGVRLINWVWTLELIRPAKVLSTEDWRRILQSVLLHVSEITRKYSFGSSTNNHLVGEAAGVYIACRYFKTIPGAEQFAARSRDILVRELLAQTNADGGTGEQALGYQLFVLQFFTLCAVVGRRAGDEFPPAFWQRLRAMYAFLAALLEGGERLPAFGDADDGYVLDLEAAPLDPRPWLAVGAALFADDSLASVSGGRMEAVQWLLGSSGSSALRAEARAYRALDAAAAPQQLSSRAFEQTGYFVLQGGKADSPDCVSLVFDCGPLGYGPLAAHGHADALSFVLRVGGRDVLVDPGTYDYFTYPERRAYYRSTPAHNTITVDGLNQSEMLGSFLWGDRATSRVLAWEPAAGGGRVVGEHDGYRRLADPVTHRREVHLDAKRGDLLVRDELLSRGRHDYALYFHLAETCSVASSDKHRIEITTGNATIVMEFDPRLNVALQRADDSGPAGWVSRGYHRKAASTIVVGRCTGDGDVVLLTRISVHASKPGVETEDALEGAESAYRSERSGVEVV